MDSLKKCRTVMVTEILMANAYLGGCTKVVR